MMDSNGVLLQWFINCLIKTSGGTIKNNIKSNKELAEELHNPIIRKFEKRKVYSSFIGNKWGADLANMQFLSKFNKGFRFSLCVIDIYIKNEWIIIINAIQKNLDENNQKSNKTWVKRGSEFYNRSMKHNERKYVAAKRFIKTLKKNLQIHDFNIKT